MNGDPWLIGLDMAHGWRYPLTRWAAHRKVRAILRRIHAKKTQNMDDIRWHRRRK